MAILRALVWIILFSTALSVHSTRFYGVPMAAPPEKTTTIASLGIVDEPEVEDSARLVPTGPDPLHHNSDPTGH